MTAGVSEIVRDDIGVDVLGGIVVRGRDVERELSATTLKGVVLAMLSSRTNERVTTEDLAEAAWAGHPPSSHRKALQVAVHGLRNDFDAKRRDGVRSTPIVGHDQAYELRLDRDRIDAIRFEALVRDGHRRLASDLPAEAARMFDEALALWGEPFAGVDVPALQAYVERLRLTRREARNGLAEAALRLGREDLSELERAVEEEPFDERRWGHLMIGLYRRGRQVDALATYGRVRALLIEEMGVEPGQYLRRLEGQILIQDPALLGPQPSFASSTVDPAADHEAAPVAKPPRWPAVPPALGPVLHREDELRAIDTQLLSWRVVTLVGPPGVGKTTLATAVAAARPSGPVAWISLADVAPGPGAVIAIAGRLGVSSEQSADEVEFGRLLAAQIGDRDLLLVLDNVEHLVDDVAETVVELTRSCPSLVILSTSRRPLELGIERVYRVEPFGDEGADYLVARAGLTAVDPASRRALVQISEHLGGLALGLEQAASRLHVISPIELAERLELATDLGGQELTRAIEWSLDLLAPHARRMLDALACLDAPWPIGRAEALGDRIGIDPSLVPSAVALLMQHSLVVDVHTGDAAMRRRIIEPVRQYVRVQRLSSDQDGTDLDLACDEVVLAEVVEAARDIEGRDQRAGLEHLSALMPDIRRTVIRGAASSDPGVVARLLAQLRGWWWASGRYADGQALHAVADPVLERWEPTSVEDEVWRIRALSTRVVAQPGFAPPALHAASLERWLEQADRVNAGPDLTSWLAQLLSSGLTFTNQDATRAEALAERAIDDARRAQDTWLLAWGRYALAVARGRADPFQTLDQLEQAISAFVAAGDQLNAARVTMFLGHGIRIFGDARGSEDAFDRATDWCLELGAAPVTQLDCELGRAQSADADGRSYEAATRYRALVPQLRELGDHRCAAVAERSLAAILAEDGDLDGASVLVSHALLTLQSLEHEEAELATAFLVRAQIAEARGQHSMSARLLGRAQDFVGGSGVPVEVRDLRRMEDLWDRLVAALGQEDAERLRADGRSDRFL